MKLPYIYDFTNAMNKDNISYYLIDLVPHALIKNRNLKQ